MATFKFGRQVNIHWNGFEVVGPAETVFSIPDQLYEEFEGDFRHVEPSLVWLDTNEFQTLKDSVPTGTYVKAAIGQSPISVSTSSSTATISLNSGTALNGYLLVADGTGGTIWNPASTSGINSVVGISPISTVISGGTVSVSLDTTATLNATNAEVVRFYVKNTTGSTIPKGSAVYVSGATGDNALISLASATSDPTSSKTLGLTLTDIPTDTFGYVVESGYITGIDTSSTSAGASVWLNNTPGSIKFVTPPDEPSHAVYLGVVVRVQSQNGSILVKVQNGYELDELHDVFVGGVSTSLPLVYSSASSGWIAQALSSVGIADNAIVAAKIAAAAVGSAAIASGSINSTHIGANAVVAGDIAENAVTSGNIATGAITSGHIASGAIGSAALANGAVVAGKIATGAVTSGNIGAFQVTESKINDGAVSETKLNDNAVISDKIAAGAVVAAKIATGAVTSGHLAANAVESSALASSAVTAAKIAAGAVNTAKIDSTGGSANWVLTANGSGGATFAAPTGGSSTISFSTYTVSSSLSTSDVDKIVQGNSTAALTITVPPNSTASITTGSQIHILQIGTGKVTIAGGTGVTVNSSLGLNMRAQWSSGTLIKRDTNTWVLVGDTAV